MCQQIPCFFMSGILGSLADRYGRKLILTISSSGQLGYLLGIIYIAYYEPDDYILILLLSSLLYGFCGGFQGFQLGCYSYLADVTNNRVKYRTLYYSILESFLILSKVVGPSSAGHYASKKGFFPPLALAGLMSILVIIYVNIIPESLPQDEQQPFIMEPLKSFQNIKLFFTLKTVKGTNPLPILAVAFGVFFTAYFGYLNVYVLYLKHVFDSSTETIGYYASTESIICVFSMLLLPIIVQKLLGNIVKSIYWVVIGYISQSIFFFLFAAVTSEKEIFLCLIILILTGPIIPMTRAIMVNSVAPHLQTTILAGFSAVQSTSQLLCPIIIIIYSDNGNFPYFPYFNIKLTIYYIVEENPSIDFYIFSAMTLVSVLLTFLLLLNPSLSENLPDHDDIVKDLLTDGTVSLSSYVAYEKINSILFGETIDDSYNDDRTNSIESIDNRFYESLLAQNDISRNQVEI